MKKESTMIILSDDIIFRKAVIHLLNVELGKFAPAQDLFMMQPDVIELVRKQVCYLLNSDELKARLEHKRTSFSESRTNE